MDHLLGLEGHLFRVIAPDLVPVRTLEVVAGLHRADDGLVRALGVAVQFCDAARGLHVAVPGQNGDIALGGGHIRVIHPHEVVQVGDDVRVGLRGAPAGISLSIAVRSDVQEFVVRGDVDVPLLARDGGLPDVRLLLIRGLVGGSHVCVREMVDVHGGVEVHLDGGLGIGLHSKRLTESVGLKLHAPFLKRGLLVP